ncbi:MAG: hypothetical protein WCA38_06950 [Candidatus Acidiferrales bacterium]|jgi:hypothetical protein
MATISDIDRSIFENLTKGIHDFNQDELICLHEVAQEVKVIMRDANERQQKAMAAGNRT